MRRVYPPKQLYKNPLDNTHWTIENYRQRVTAKQWREILLHKDDYLVFHGHGCRIIGKNLGAGVWEIYKAPQGEKK